MTTDQVKIIFGRAAEQHAVEPPKQGEYEVMTEEYRLELEEIDTLRRFALRAREPENRYFTST